MKGCRCDLLKRCRLIFGAIFLMVSACLSSVVVSAETIELHVTGTMPIPQEGATLPELQLSDYVLEGAADEYSIIGVSWYKKADTGYVKVSAGDIYDSYQYYWVGIEIEMDKSQRINCYLNGVLYNSATEYKRNEKYYKTYYFKATPYGTTNTFDDDGNIVFGISSVQDKAGIGAVFTVPNHVASIEIIWVAGGFLQDCEQLETLIFSEGIKYVSMDAFKNCTNLQTIKLPASIEKFSTAFAGCTKLANIEISANNNKFTVKDGVVFSKDEKTLVYYPAGKTDASYQVPEGVTTIADFAFDSHTYLQTVKLPMTVEEIGGYNFYNCSRLNGIYIENPNCTWDITAFLDCPSDFTIYAHEDSKVKAKADSLALPFKGMHFEETLEAVDATCTTAGRTEGSCCSVCRVVLKEQTEIPAKGHSWDAGTETKAPKALEEGVWTYTCTACKMQRTEAIAAKGAPKKGVVLEDKATNAVYKVTKSGVKGGSVEYVKPVTKQAVVTIKNTVTIDGITYKVTSIASNAFKNNTKITSVTIPSNIVKISDKAFYRCKKLKTVKMGKNVTTIGKQAFYNCIALKSITLEKKVKKIGSKAFYGCKKLTRITIKTTKLTNANVGSNAFKGAGKSNYKKLIVKLPKQKRSKYKKLLLKKGLNKKVKIQ